MRKSSSSFTYRSLSFWTTVTLMMCLYIENVSTADTMRETYRNLVNFITSNPYSMDKIGPGAGNLNVTVKVNIGFETHRIVNVNEAYLTMTVSGVLFLEWVDPSLAWNPSDYGGLDVVTVPADDIWTPRIGNLQSVDSNAVYLNLGRYVDVLSPGVVVSVRTASLETTCGYDLTYYPFDSQTCKLDFVAQGGLSSVIELQPSNAAKIFNVFVDSHSAEWDYLGTTREKTLRQVIPGVEVSYVHFAIRIKRRSTFYIINIIFPIMTTTLLTLAVFWIPASSGEKLSFLVSIFLSMTMFLTTVSDVMPRGSCNISRINFFILLVVLTNAFAIVATIYVLRRYAWEQSREDSLEDKNHQGHEETAQGDQMTDEGHADAKKHLGELYSNLVLSDDKMQKSRSAPFWSTNEVVTDGSDMYNYKNSTALSCFQSFGDKVKTVLLLLSKPLSSNTLDKIFFCLFTLVSLFLFILLFFI